MQVSQFVRELGKHGISSFYGVPDSLLKNFCAYISDSVNSQNHVIAANEGNAIGLACGHYLATGRPALVYMQNSGQGNCINPLLSLMDEEVYSIPVLLLIGWRGEPGVKDEPQHVKQGKLTLPLLETMGIEYEILSPSAEQASRQIKHASHYMNTRRAAFALVVRKGTFDAYSSQTPPIHMGAMSREEAVCLVANALDSSDVVVSTTGQLSRELYEYRTATTGFHHSDFLTVGGMGHASSIAMGIALNKPERRIICLDGDGALLMHMGATAIIGNNNVTNMRHVIFNNSAHDSVGGQRTVAGKLDLQKIAHSCGYKVFYRASSSEELNHILPIFLSSEGPAMLEIPVKCGSRDNLGRPKERPTENKHTFMTFLEEGQARIYPGALHSLTTLIQENNWKNILLFSTERRLKAVDKQLSQILAHTNLTVYTAISPNPSVQDIKKALSLVHQPFDVILALGGGSCIDFAKLFRASIDNNIDIKEYFRSPSPLICKTPLVAIPTTAGTGSEATRFAVVYIDGEKYSLDSPAVMPNYAIIDSELMSDAPAYLKASCGMDAFAQAIEGFWANGATEESDRYAQEAIRICKDNLEAFVLSSTPESCKNMARASYLAGKCISIARTTAAHALSYKITHLYGIPHGHAVALSLPGLIDLHARKAITGSPLQRKIDWLSSTFNVPPFELNKWFLSLYSRIGLQSNLTQLQISSSEDIVDGVNTERLTNNPLTLHKEDMMGLFNQTPHH